MPDLHIKGVAPGVAKHIVSYREKGDIDLVSLEGLSGDVGPAYMQEIKKARSHWDHLGQLRAEADEEWKSLKERKLKKSLMANLADIAMFDLNPKSTCCDIPAALLRAPGGPYAILLEDKVPLFGFEDKETYEACANVFALSQQNTLHQFLKGLSEPAIVKFFERHYYRPEYAASAERLEKEHGISTEADFNEFYEETAVKKRSKIAVNNTVDRLPQGTACLVMGYGHEDTIKKECDERQLSLARPKL